MTTEEYQKLLDQHDWWWPFSDSFTVIDKGYDNEKKLKALWSVNPEFKVLYKNISDKIFKPKTNGKEQDELP